MLYIGVAGGKDTMRVLSMSTNAPYISGSLMPNSLLKASLPSAASIALPHVYCDFSMRVVIRFMSGQSTCEASIWPNNEMMTGAICSSNYA